MSSTKSTPAPGVAELARRRAHSRREVELAVTSAIRPITANPTDFKWFKGLTVHNWVSA